MAIKPTGEERIFVDHLKKWADYPKQGVLINRFFSRSSGPGEPEISPELLLELKKDSLDVFNKFKNNQLNTAFKEIFDKIDKELKEDSSWKEVPQIKSRFDEGKSEEEIKLEIFASYIFQIQTRIFTDVKGLRLEFDKLPESKKNEFKTLVNKAKEYYSTYQAELPKEGRSRGFNLS